MYKISIWAGDDETSYVHPDLLLWDGTLYTYFNYQMVFIEGRKREKYDAVLPAERPFIYEYGELYDKDL